MTAATHTLSREFDNGRIVTVTVSGQADIDDIVDVMRGFLVQLGYHPDVAKRLHLADEEDDSR
ncbi:hypothetical protein [Pseudothauera rhizosphaerae]|uniref:Uncharacterized protein n=1 Tax=Pseudothauera rhizosphaerae TaxID=2565932 RepID=A0A4S4AFY5_9RHOO|nr:hypothetical protein [Pseudothauera rhizosphaerae]THF58048.1 hypothetical protein E6O51_17045 [Pseudothauera rhizosphaerae]